MTGTSATISTTNLRMQYAATRVLDDVTLSIGRGEVVALLGPNGAGKTTTIEILEGFRVPSGGEVSVLGETPHTASEAWRARVGVVLQSWRDHGKWRVEEFLDYLSLYYTDYATPEVQRPWPTGDLLERVGLGAKKQRRLDRLSGGERRRLDVAIGLVGRPEVLFLDEPTAGFDPQARHDFHELIRGLSDLDTTILLTTHDLTEAELLAGRILVLAGGTIVADGSPDDLRHRMSATASVRYRRDGQLHNESTDDPVALLRDVLARPGEITELEVRRASLEEAYLALVHQVETGAETQAASFGILPDEPTDEPTDDQADTGVEPVDKEV
ncbi:ABC transporter ATP-binding protein [Ornithinimicrobium faecis]|uniref:ABC transporter ATP-binding protein n=1 Tax=Ornithinimicrobium faecis TaxID=2934158 RepID=A0ABY4YTI9_9MICO|nr:MULTISPECIES: ABC transporter ATP-binding protein [unclassified Ornithinimicrobium]USQ80096.1 ABC transporter ATP-binding protein [Ornithinimicrobium sp. HY1793]